MKQHKAAQHPSVALEVQEGQFFNIALKMSPKDLQTSKQLRIAIERNYIPEYTASMLKSAHLTLFQVLGYKYVFGVAGQWLGGILRRFYLENYTKDRKTQETKGKDYFAAYAGMIVPLQGFDLETLRGSIEDSRFLMCIGSSGAFYSLGVSMRTNDSMHIVFTPPEQHDHMDTYCNLIEDIRRKEFRYHIAEFANDSEEGPRWEVFGGEPQVFI